MARGFYRIEHEGIPDALDILLLAEKPDAAARIARALDEGHQPKRLKSGNVPAYETRWGGHRLIVASALGHLYALRARDEKDRERYPVYSVEWVPRDLIERNSQVGRWIEALKGFGSNMDVYVNCCDYDIEGSLIGYNVLRYACSAPPGNCRRMKVSTLVEGEIRDSFANLQPTLDFNMIDAGETRHIVDFIYGVNLSRALTNAVRPNVKTHVTISTGRVQGPTLKFLVEREREGRAFVPVPYWVIEAKVDVDGVILHAQYERERIGGLDEARAILEDCRGKAGKVIAVVRTIAQIPPPTPFDIGALQSEAYRAFGFTPSRTLRVSEGLYLEALISYPRTGSQKLPPGIGFRDIIAGMRVDYGKAADDLLRQRDLSPREGKKDDPAHPAIYPTGQRPERALTADEGKLLDLISRRFLATFAPSAVRESVRIEMGIGGRKFLLHGRRMLERGWVDVYGPYSAYSDEAIPELAEGQDVRVAEVVSEGRYTQPPPRFNPASIVKRMEDEGIGTKATRAEMVETLYRRGYASGERMEASELGLALIETLEKFCPTIISVRLTSELEGEMEGIELGQLEKGAVIDSAIKELGPSLEAIKGREGEIGRSLSRGAISALALRRAVGDCPACGTGRLTIIYSKKSGKRFVGCSNYSQGRCSYSAPLPQRPYTVRPTRARCRECGWPVLAVLKRGRRPWRLCVNKACPAKARRTPCEKP